MATFVKKKQALTCQAGDRNEVTVIALDHARQKRFVGPEMSAYVHVHCAFDLFIGEIKKIFTAHNASVVDQHVHGAHLLLHSIGGLVDSLFARHVHLVSETLSPDLFDQLLCFD